ncbi:MAG: ATP-binding protein [Steroidobacteraceae bacterium]
MINQHVEVPAPDGVGHRLSTVLPFRHEASGFSGVIGVITDVTELQRARASRAARREALAGAWRSRAPAPRVGTRLEHGTDLALAAHGAMLGFGRTALEFTLDQIDDLVHPDDLPVRAGAACASGWTVARPTGIEMQYRLRCADGSYRWMLARGAVVDRDFSGRPRRLVGTHTDIDDEYEGRDRAAQARQLESLGRLAAGVAHEINTPLQFVSDSVSFLRSGMDDIAQLAASCGQCGLERASVDMPRALELVQQGIMRIAEIVRGMRVFAHPDSQAMEPVRVEDLLHSALAIARHEYKHVAEIRTAFAELPPLPCHPGELSQVFVNVIVNAAHAIAERGGGGTSPGVIELRTSRDADSIVIEIEDTGCGIEPECLERIFDPFYTTKPSGQGTGQGLAIARTVVEQHHGGRIGARSRVGQGTVIRIVLPLGASRDLAAA